MSKILVTGGAGFIGGFVSCALAREGHEVHIVDNFRRGRHDGFLTQLLRSAAVRLDRRDLTSADGLQGLATDYNCIFHFAAALGVQNVIRHPYATLRDNVVLVDKVVQLARAQKNLQRLVFPSTSEVYAGSLEYLDIPIPTPESTPIALPDLRQPRTSYMLSKLCGEALVAYSGVPYTIVRPHNFYGPRMGLSHVVPQLLEKAHRAEDGGTLEVFSIEHSRTFCYIDDAVKMITRAAAAAECEGATLNIGTQAPEIRIGDLASVILEVVGKQLSILAKPPTPGSPARRCPDMQLTEKLIGYESRVSLQEGVRRTYEWYRDEIFSGRESEVAI